MNYKVEFENNIPVRAILVAQIPITERAAFDQENGKSIIKYLFLEAENNHHAIYQAKKIVETVFRFN
jgi:hypothetical protein